MPNINLTTENYSKKNPNLMGKGLFFSIILLVLTFILYGALLIANQVLSSKIQGNQDEYNIEYNKFLSGDGNDIIDFENRGKEAEKMIVENRSIADILSQIEKSMLSSVYINSLKYDRNKKTVSLLCIGDNFQTVAKQILSFKQNEYFSAIIPGQSSLNLENNNKINFNINLQIK